MAQEEAVEYEPCRDERAQPEGNRADHAEEAQRPLRETHEEEHAEDVESATNVIARRGVAVEAVARRLPHVDFDHTKALTIRQHGQEAMLIAVQRDLFQHAPVECPRAAAKVAIVLAGYLPENAVENLPPHSFEA